MVQPLAERLIDYHADNSRVLTLRQLNLAGAIEWNRIDFFALAAPHKLAPRARGRAEPQRCVGSTYVGSTCVTGTDRTLVEEGL